MSAFARNTLALLAAAALFVWTQPVHADDLSELERGRGSYEAGRYGEGATRFRDMLDPASEHHLSDPLVVEKARTYYAACLIAQGQNEEAGRLIEAILRENPSASPDPAVFPSVVLDRFADVRGKLRQELEARAKARAEAERLERQRESDRQKLERERIARLELMARQELRVQQNSRWVAMIPFGAGQFQNGQPALAWTLLSTEVLLATTSVVTSGLIQSLASQGSNPGVDITELNSRTHTFRLVNHISFYSFAGLAVAGVLHAQITFVPEKSSIRERAVPKSPQLTPLVELQNSGGSLGLSGIF